MIKHMFIHTIKTYRVQVVGVVMTASHTKHICPVPGHIEQPYVLCHYDTFGVYLFSKKYSLYQYDSSYGYQNILL